MPKEGILQKASHIIPDEMYIRLRFRQRMHKKLNLSSPTTYNEKLQWLKLHYHNPELVTLVDKYEVKPWVAKRIGEDHIIPTLGVWERFDDIDFRTLPNQFVLKCTHDSGGLVICKDRNIFDVNAARKKINEAMSANYFWHNREWPYRFVKPRIIAEEYMVDESGYELKDYKLFCFDGLVKFLFVATDRGVEGEDTKFDFFDECFNHMEIRNGHKNATRKIECPLGFEEMKKYAALLSKGFPEVRVDFYDVNGRVYFGEMTFYHWGGLMPFEPEKWDEIFGSYIQLPEE